MLTVYTKELKEELVKIVKKHKLSLLILFGSQAKNTQTKKSDWDFAYYPPNNFSIEKDMKLFEDISQTLNDEKIDLINIKTSNKLHVINNIFQTGTLIYEKRKTLFKKMKWDSWFNLQDFKHYYEKQFELDKKQLMDMYSDNGN